jgi:hypothetical protein
VRQVLAPQTKWPGQGWAGCAQAPAPSQEPTGLLVEPVQLAVPQLAPALALRQAPAPSQVPSNPQGGLGAQRACGSALPAGTGWHDPAEPVRLQTWQLPQLGDEQQTPSTQLPLPHSVPAAQIWPSRFGPQDPALQTLGARQSPSLAQTATQPWVAALQAKGVQVWVVAGLQVPAPSQVRASAAIIGSAVQAGGAHCVPAAKSWQAPAPLQKPVVPQVEAPWFVHWPVGSEPPTGTGEQVPGLPDRAHDMHLPVQAVPQQTP